MILAPINDAECLVQLTTIARELASTTLVRTVARHLGSREAVIRWIQAKPQHDDDGRESVRYIVCDVPQRVRLLADDPNCVERATDALMLLEALEQMSLAKAALRALGTIERPLRHTGLVEKRGERWCALDLFPRRNARRNLDASETGKDVLQGVHSYVGKPLLQFYGLGGAADTLGENENKLIGRDKKTDAKQQQPSTKTSFTPPPNTGSLPVGKPKPGAAAAGQSGAKGSAVATRRKGGKDGETEKKGSLLRATVARPADHGDGAATGAEEVEEERFRGWWGLE